MWQEHRGTSCVPQLCATRPIWKRAVPGTGSGGRWDTGRRSLPVAYLLAQLVLLDAGWEAVNLSPNTPLASLAKSLQELRPRLLWLSVSYYRTRRASSAYRDLYRAAERQGVAVAVGGQTLR